MKRLGLEIVEEQNRSLFVAGVRETLPVLLGIFPFGIIVGLTGVELGFTTGEITLMSAVVYAGAAQLAAMFLMAEGAHVALVLLTAIMINVRFSMYSASLAPYFRSYSRLKKIGYSFLIVDPTYALSIPHFRHSSHDRSHWFYLGSGLTNWLFWILGTAIGAGMGVDVPDAFPIELVLPLVFIALLFPVLTDRPTVVTALVAAAVATVAAPLDYNLGLLAGVTCGVVVGVILKR